jgi:hypothetical protein
MLLAQLLPHTCIGHPVAAALNYLGLQNAASWVHHTTLPIRAKRRILGRAAFNSDKRLLSMDMIFTPLCSVARAFGLYKLADFIFRLGPHGLATEVGACGYYYKESREEKAENTETSRLEKKSKTISTDACIAALKSRGFTIELVTGKGTAIHYPWVWVAPKSHKPTAEESDWIHISGHLLKGSVEKDFEYQKLK